MKTFSTTIISAVICKAFLICMLLAMQISLKGQFNYQLSTLNKYSLSNALLEQFNDKNQPTQVLDSVYEYIFSFDAEYNYKWFYYYTENSNLAKTTRFLLNSEKQAIGIKETTFYNEHEKIKEYQLTGPIYLYNEETNETEIVLVKKDKYLYQDTLDVVNYVRYFPNEFQSIDSIKYNEYKQKVWYKSYFSDTFSKVDFYYNSDHILTHRVSYFPFSSIYLEKFDYNFTDTSETTIKKTAPIFLNQHIDSITEWENEYTFTKVFDAYNKVKYCSYFSKKNYSSLNYKAYYSYSETNKLLQISYHTSSMFDTSTYIESNIINYNYDEHDRLKYKEQLFFNDKYNLWQIEKSFNYFYGEPLINSLAENPITYNIYPNPASNYINFPTQYTGSKYYIISMDGKLIKSGLLKSNSIRISDLHKGYYLLNINNQLNTYTLKFIKN